MAAEAEAPPPFHIFIMLKKSLPVFLTLLLVAEPSFAQSKTNSSVPVEDAPLPTMSTMVITDSRAEDASSPSSRLDPGAIAAQRASTSDATQLLQSIPGVSAYSAGGISALPVVRGIADDRLRVQVDGMDLMQACPNHMNSVLSYIDPSRIEAIDLFAGITPVSVGGDSIGSTIQVKSAPPKFASPEQGLLMSGEFGVLSRSNGKAHGNNYGFSMAGENIHVSFSESNSESENYSAAGEFKKPGAWKNNLLGVSTGGARYVSSHEVGASEYGGSRNRDLGLAIRIQQHLLELHVAEQRLDYEGFPNQRMDMVGSVPDPADPTLVPPMYVIDKNRPSNVNRTINLRYTGRMNWGDLEAQMFHQDIRHHMDLLQERRFMLLMPMDTKATNLGGQLKASIEISPEDILRVGGDFKNYHLEDWWPPIFGGASMCCDDFWNIRDGQRNRLGVFAELETRWTPSWMTLAGVRHDRVGMDAGKAQGYAVASYQADADKFNARDHQRTDRNIDWTLLARYTPNARSTYEVGVARKTRSPNVHERYPWSTFAMAALMNNFVGDGNGYVGNLDLRPEIAHTLSATADWHDAERSDWKIKASAYLTQVKDFIDARRCGPPVCNTTTYLTTATQYVLLQYVNQSARLYGADLSGELLLGRLEGAGSFTATGAISYVRGENRTTGDNLYHMMPLNVKAGLIHRLGAWTNALEVQFVDAKLHTSRVRNEITTPDYTIVNFNTTYEWKHARLDVGVENAFNKHYLLPLGGAYVGEGNTMTTAGVPWGMGIPGKARSLNAALSFKF